MTAKQTTSDPIEALQNLVHVVDRLQNRVLELEAKHRVDQDFIHCLTLMIENPEGLREIWRHAVSAVAADSALRFLKIEDDANPEQLALVKGAMNDRFEFWRERIQSAVDLRAGDDTE